MHRKKEKGDIGVTFAIAAATNQGWSCCIPISEHQKYDFIAEKNGICKRIQSRYTTPKNNKMDVKLRSSWNDRNGTHITKRLKEDFDVLSVYNPETKSVYFVSGEDFDNDNAITLRLSIPKNGQIKGIRMAENFSFLK